MRKRMRKNRTKGIISIALALVMVMALATPAPAANAAAKAKMTVKVTSPKKNVKLTGALLTVHGKKSVRLNVKCGGRNVTAKAKYKSSNTRVVSVKKGKLTVKKNGGAVITVKCNGVTKKFKVVAGNHSWKAHKKTKTVKRNVMRCNCGIILSDLDEQKYCEKCVKECIQPKNGYICYCKSNEHTINHVLNGEPSNCYSDYDTKKVTYTDYYHCTCGAKKAGETEPK